MEPYQIINQPIYTEKGVIAKEKSCYLFKVSKLATKIEIRNAIEKMFKVKVEKVNTVPGRAKQRLAKGGVGKTSSYKKAYVKLLAGQKIEELEV